MIGKSIRWAVNPKRKMPFTGGFYPNKDEQIRGNMLDAINFDQMDKYDSVQISKFAAYEIVDIIKEIDNDC
ncbi:MAG: hypothetical protein IPJ51_24095 [Saprospiraceae bacterium]|nr:hypothetical protein [Saprospiraceae bacterium]